MRTFMIYSLNFQIYNTISLIMGFPWWLSGKESACNAGKPQETQVQYLVRKIPWRKAWQPVLAWWIPWTEEPGRLQSMRSQRARHDWRDSPCIHTLLILVTRISLFKWKFIHFDCLHFSCAPPALFPGTNLFSMNKVNNSNQILNYTISHVNRF